jgi:MazG family protein
MSNSVENEFLRLVNIMNELREQCPWDRKQTVQSLRQLTIEETYELADAITESDWKGIKEELGDLLLHIVFYAKIGSEQNQFTLTEVISGICEKLIARHPHIYGEIEVKDDEEVKRNWEKLKLKEGKESILGGVPQSLPATVKAMRLQEKAKQVGFEWENASQVWDKVMEEMNELTSAVKEYENLEVRQEPVTNNVQSLMTDDRLQKKVEEEFGDLVFSLINYARFLQVDAENALEKTNKKFINRFNQMEEKALQQGKPLSQMSLGEMDSLWDHIKRENI